MNGSHQYDDEFSGCIKGVNFLTTWRLHAFQRKESSFNWIFEESPEWAAILLPIKDITTSTDALGAKSKKKVKEKITLEQGTKTQRGVEV